MSPDRWRKIEELYHAVRESPAERHAALLAAADPALRGEVESLLRAGEEKTLPALEVPPIVTIQPGTRLGPYLVESKLGEGGMGEVFRGMDTRLGRTVAIKVVHGQFDARFEREARAISSLNHPHICTLYDIGPNYLVMEYLDGAPLKGPLPLDEALRYGEEICDALDTAHQKGIVHRDLKPGNILLTKRGIKLLDFGLAHIQPGPDDPTLTQLTHVNAVMGTPAYMAPEQREGKRADARSDIYAFGCVFYEMLTGRRASGLVTAGSTSPEAESIIFKCLQTDPELRYQQVSEIGSELVRLRRNPVSLPATPEAPPKRKWLISSVAVALVAAATVAWFAVRPASAKLTDHDTIVVADFVNKTGEPAFDDILREGLIVQLQQSPFLSLVPDEKIRARLKLMSKPADFPMTGDTAREVCEGVGARAVLTGLITRLGTRYVMTLRAEGCANGDALDSEQGDAPGKEQVLKTLGDMAGRLRTRMGESFATVQEHNVPLEEATTSSLEALKSYTAAMKVSGASIGDNVRGLKRATELDPQFASAWSFLAIHYSNLGETALARESAIHAYEARDRASGPEKFNIEYSYHRNVTGNLEKAWASISLWRATYPRDSKAFSLSGGYAANGTGRFEPALAATEQAIRMNPDLPVTYGNRANILFHLGRFDEAEKALADAEAHHDMSADLLAYRYRLALLKQDRTGADAAVAMSHSQSENELAMWHVQALAAARDGRLVDADGDFRRAIEMARDAGLPERAAVVRAAQGVWSSFYGNRDAARQDAEAALKMFSGREVEYAAGFALGLAGEAARADAIADTLDKEHPEDTQVQATYVPTLRALSALARNDAPKAVDLLEVNRHYEFAIPPLAFNHFFGNMYPLYVRGLAYMAMHREEEAAAEFSRLLAHPWLSAGDPVDAAARRQLARALGLARDKAAGDMSAGDKAKTRAAYSDILTVWKNADPGLPILKQTQAEYVRLQ